jgi:hypothetical protein
MRGNLEEYKSEKSEKVGVVVDDHAVAFLLHRAQS